MRDILKREYNKAYFNWQGVAAYHNLTQYTNEELVEQIATFRLWAEDDQKRLELHKSNYLQQAKLVLALHLNVSKANHHGERRSEERITC